MPPTSSVSQAKVSAVGKLFATSIAKLGPDKTAIGLSGKKLFAISLIRLSVLISTPFEHRTIGTSLSILLEISFKVFLKYCAGVTKKSKSLILINLKLL